MTDSREAHTAERGRRAVEELANTQMNISMEDWSRISSAILGAIDLPSQGQSINGIQRWDDYYDESGYVGMCKDDNGMWLEYSEVSSLLSTPHTPETTAELIEAGDLTGDEPCDCGECTVEECNDCMVPKPQSHTPETAPVSEAGEELREKTIRECAEIAWNFSDSQRVAYDIRTGIFPNQSDPQSGIASAIEALLSKNDGWTKKSKGNAKVYMHPNAFEGRAIIQNHRGIEFNGVRFATLDDAKTAALSKANRSL